MALIRRFIAVREITEQFCEGRADAMSILLEKDLDAVWLHGAETTMAFGLDASDYLDGLWSVLHMSDPTTYQSKQGVNSCKLP